MRVCFRKVFTEGRKAFLSRKCKEEIFDYENFKLLYVIRLTNKNICNILDSDI